MRFIEILLSVAFSVICFGERPDVYLDSRHDPIAVDGLIEAEWENHDAQTFETSRFEGRWKGCYDNTYYYFLIEADDPEALTNNVHLELYGWEGRCDPLPWPVSGRVDEPEHFYRIVWSRNSNVVRVYKDDLFFHYDGPALSNHGVLLSHTITAGGYVVEVAVPGELIEALLGAGGDYSWTDEIRLSLGADLLGASDAHWPGPDTPYALCDMALIGFSGWPDNAIDTTPASLRSGSSGGPVEMTLHFPDAEAPLSYTLTKNHEWIS